MRIEEFDPKADTDSLRACHQIALAGHKYDTPFMPPPSFNAFKGEWAHGWGLGDVSETWLGRDNSGAAVGCYRLRLSEHDNRDVAFCSPMVTPDRRRSGAGSALVAHCADRARAAGRYRLQGFAPDGSAGEAFARAKGATGGIDAVMRTMDIDASLPARLAELRTAAQSQADGYELLSWQAPTPEEHLGQLVELERLIADAPRDEDMEPMAIDADRIRGMEGAMLALGVHNYTVVARHSASGELVALSEIAVDPETPDWGFQQLTSVRREHRGHRLGLLVKIAMLDLLAEREPGLQHIFTGNAGANEHMIAINELLGYHIAATMRSWELSLVRS
jgi:GNAT superfamily N-acetyltransferase/RimJ/RimL family protein N-acetyltransferase